MKRKIIVLLILFLVIVSGCVENQQQDKSEKYDNLEELNNNHIENLEKEYRFFYSMNLDDSYVINFTIDKSNNKSYGEGIIYLQGEFDERLLFYQTKNKLYRSSSKGNTPTLVKNNSYNIQMLGSGPLNMVYEKKDISDTQFINRNWNKFINTRTLNKYASLNHTGKTEINDHEVDKYEIFNESSLKLLIENVYENSSMSNNENITEDYNEFRNAINGFNYTIYVNNNDTIIKQDIDLLLGKANIELIYELKKNGNVKINKPEEFDDAVRLDS